MTPKFKFLVEKAGKIGKNIKLFSVSIIFFSLLKNSSGLFSFISKKPDFFVLITDGFMEVISVNSKKKVKIETDYDITLCENVLLQVIKEVNNA